MSASSRLDPASPASGPGWRTRGQPTALAAIAGMVRGPAPHAVLLVGPPSVGKTTLAEDLATGLLCEATDPASRPCRACRSCRLVAAGNHPDVHRLAPVGPGGQVVIGDTREARGARGVRDLLRDIALLPVEGGARVAIVEGAGQMNEDAQNALLKTLEEPSPGVTIVLCVDREELLLPTVRSRCARVRLGPTGARAIEGLLGELGLADATTAARLGRIAGGRPGVALAYARDPDAVTIRDELARTLLDLLAASRAARLAAAADLMARGRDLAAALSSLDPVSTRPPALAAAPGVATDEPIPEAEDPAPGGAVRLAPTERRRGARQLIDVWRDLGRDLAVASTAGTPGRRLLHDPVLLEEIETAAHDLEDGAMAAFLVRLDRAAEQVAGNVSPELAIDVLLLAWPSVRRTGA